VGNVSPTLMSIKRVVLITALPRSDQPAHLAGPRLMLGVRRVGHSGGISAARRSETPSCVAGGLFRKGMSCR
jgi:hypothetical protein